MKLEKLLEEATKAASFHVRTMEEILAGVKKTARFRDRSPETLERLIDHYERNLLPEFSLRLTLAVEVLKPFTHPDLSKQLPKNIDGEKSPVFRRGKALLVLGDFLRAAEAFREIEGSE